MSFQWLMNGSTISGATQSTYTITNAQMTNQGSYSCAIVNGGGLAVSSNATLTVLGPPYITAQPQNQGGVGGPGSTATFSVSAIGPGTLAYQWFYDGAKMGPASTSSNLTVNIGSPQVGSYYVVITNSYGAVTSAVATLAQYTAPTISGPGSQPANTTALMGGTASLTVVASGTAPLGYQWNLGGSPLVDGTNISGSLSNVLTLSNVQTNQAGSYTVVVTNAWGSVTSQAATLTVNVPATITTQPQSLTPALGQNATFTVAAIGTGNLTYQWYFNGVAIGGPPGSGTSLNLTSVTPANAGSYTVVVNNSYGSVTSAVATLTLSGAPTVATQPASEAVVLGQNASFSVVASGTAPLTYQWSFNGAALPGATSSALTLPNVQTNQAGAYAVLVTNASGSVTSTNATLTVYVPPSVTTQPQSVAVNVGNSASFSVGAAGSGPFTYQWYLNGSALPGEESKGVSLAVGNAQTNAAGSYWVVVTGSGGSVTSAVATLTVYVPPSFSGGLSGESVVQGQTAVFSVTGNGSPAPAYQWNLNGTNLVDGPYISQFAGTNIITYASGSATATLTLSNVQPAQAGNVFVVLTNFGGSATSQVVTLTVYVPSTITNQPQPQAALAGGSATFSVAAVGTPNLSYEWYLNGVSLGGGGFNGPAITLSPVGTNNTGNYKVVVNNQYGTVTSSVVSLTALMSEPISQTVGAGQSTSFSVAMSSPANLSYQWSYNGTNLTGATNATLTLSNVQTNQAGNYAVAVTTPAGILNSSAATLTVLPYIVSTVTNLNDSGPGSFRQAIINANFFAGTNVILFNIPGSGPFEISALSLLPLITNTVIIDATTQPGYSISNRPIVQLDGKSLPNGATGDGLVFTASGCIIKGMDISDFPGNGITLSNGSGSVIEGNFIGCALDGASKLPNATNGIMIFNSASNIIGGTAAFTQNVVVNSGNDGIHIEGAGSIGNQVLGNIVGMNSTGTGQSVGMGANGIVISNASWNVIGGTNTGAGNLSSGNKGYGIVIGGAGAVFNVVQGNFIGTDITGTNAAGSSAGGIFITNASSNLIGGLTYSAANVISGNGANGIAINGTSAQYNAVRGNFIGTDLTGTLNLKNNSAGVYSTGASNNTVGGLATGAGNVIAHNGSPGVIVSGGQCAILVNSLFGNGNSGDISLLNAGNGNAVPPVVTSVSNNTAVTWISAVLTNQPNTAYRIEFYASPNSADAKTFLGAMNIVTAGTGVTNFNAAFITGNITNQYLTATATDANGDTSQLSGSAVINFNGMPVILASPTNVIASAGSSVAFSVVATGSPAPVYQWYYNGSPLIGATAPSLVLNSVTTSNAGNYRVMVGNSYGSVGSGVATLAVSIPSFKLSTSVGAGPGPGSNGFTFNFPVPVGCTYIVEASSDLYNWTPIYTNIAASPSVDFADASATNFSKRFYRVAVH